MTALPFAFEGEVFRNIRRHGHEADVVVRWNDEQLALRARRRIGAITDRDALAALTALPYGLPVSWNDIDPVIAAVLDTLPSDLVQREKDTIRRFYSPPLDVVGVMKRTNRWTEGFEATTYLGRGAPRGVILTSRRDLPRITREAETLGIGVAVDRPGGYQVVVPPSTRYMRFDDLTWLLAELVFLQVNQGQCHAAQALS